MSRTAVGHLTNTVLALIVTDISLCMCVCVCSLSALLAFIYSRCYVCCVAVLRLLKEGADPSTLIPSGGSLLHLVRHTHTSFIPWSQFLIANCNLTQRFQPEF